MELDIYPLILFGMHHPSNPALGLKRNLSVRIMP